MKRLVSILVGLLFVVLVTAQEEVKHLYEIDRTELTTLRFMDKDSVVHRFNIDRRLIGFMKEFSAWTTLHKVDMHRFTDIEGIYIVKDMPTTYAAGHYIPNLYGKDFIYISNKIMFNSTKQIVLFHELYHFMVEGSLLKGSIHCDSEGCPRLANKNLQSKLPYIYNNYEDEMTKFMLILKNYQEYVKKKG